MKSRQGLGLIIGLIGLLPSLVGSALPPPACVALGKLGNHLRTTHRDILGVVLDTDLYPPKNIVRFLAADQGNGELHIQAYIQNRELIVYKQLIHEGEDPQEAPSTSFQFELPTAFTDARVSKIVHLINRPQQPYAIALGVGNQVWLMNILTGKIIQKFTTGRPDDQVQAVVLATHHLAASVSGAILFFNPSLQEGNLFENRPEATYPTPEGVAHHLMLSHYENFRQEDEPVTTIVADDEEPWKTEQVIQGALHIHFSPLILAAVGHTLHFLSFPTPQDFVTFPQMTFSHPITQMLVLGIKNIPSLEGEADILLVRIGNAQRSRVLAAPYLKQLSDRDKPTLPYAAKAMPSEADSPHMLLITYHTPEEQDAVEPVSAHAALLIANRDYSQGTLLDMSGGKFGAVVSPSSIDEIVEIADPHNLFE